MVDVVDYARFKILNNSNMCDVAEPNERGLAASRCAARLHVIRSGANHMGVGLCSRGHCTMRIN